MSSFARSMLHTNARNCFEELPSRLVGLEMLLDYRALGPQLSRLAARGKRPLPVAKM